MHTEKAEIDSWHKTALDQDDIKRFCEKNNLPFHVFDLGPAMAGNPYFSFVFTGDKSNEYNKGNTNHWMFVFGPKQPNQQPKQLFDSYGSASSYDLPQGVVMLKQSPTRLQEYAPASVCGQYCCVFYHWLKNDFMKRDDYKLHNIGREFVHHFGLGEKRLHNDSIILEEFKKLGSIPQNKPSHISTPGLVKLPPIPESNDKPSEKTDGTPKPSETKTTDAPQIGMVENGEEKEKPSTEP